MCTSINNTKAQVFTEIRKNVPLIIVETEWLHDFITILPEDMHRGTVSISPDEKKRKKKWVIFSWNWRNYIYFSDKDTYIWSAKWISEHQQHCWLGQSLTYSYLMSFRHSQVFCLVFIFYSEKFQVICRPASCLLSLWRSSL